MTYILRRALIVLSLLLLPEVASARPMVGDIFRQPASMGPEPSMFKGWEYMGGGSVGDDEIYLLFNNKRSWILAATQAVTRGKRGEILVARIIATQTVTPVGKEQLVEHCMLKDQSPELAFFDGKTARGYFITNGKIQKRVWRPSPGECSFNDHED